MYEVTARLKVREGELEGFKRQAAEMMRLARELGERRGHPGPRAG